MKAPLVKFSPLKAGAKAADFTQSGSVALESGIFGIDVRRDILARVVRWQLARRRAGTHKTRGISEIQGTTARPWAQKGTGRARQGSRRSPQFRGGAVIFGPQVRSHAHKLTKKFRLLGLKMALSAKIKMGALRVVDNLEEGSDKTAILAKKLAALDARSALIVVAEKSPQLNRSAANIAYVDVIPVCGLNVYDMLRRRCVILTRDCLKPLQERLS